MATHTLNITVICLGNRLSVTQSQGDSNHTRILGLPLFSLSVDGEHGQLGMEPLVVGGDEDSGQ